MKRSVLASVFAFVVLSPLSGALAGYSNLFVFGDSLSDSGNNAVVLAPNVTPVPISGNSFIATFPYASGRYTNAQVWAQILASLTRPQRQPVTNRRDRLCVWRSLDRAAYAKSLSERITEPVSSEP